jgi:hypothetical protein
LNIIMGTLSVVGQAGSRSGRDLGRRTGRRNGRRVKVTGSSIVGADLNLERDGEVRAKGEVIGNARWRRQVRTPAGRVYRTLT